ncbi:vegetative incompatibility protein HET-E-1 [Fusarium oxysporum f. sp. phaseoli]
MAEALGITSSVIAVVELSAKVINWCVRYAQDVSHAKEEKKRLVDEVTRLNLASVNARELLCGPHGSRLKASHALYLATVNGQSQLRRIASQLAEGSDQGNISFEALKWPFKSNDLQTVIQDLHRCTEAIYSALEVDQTSILLDVDHKIALETLPIAEGASFDSHAEEHNPTCLANTREELLREIDRWIDNPNSETIFWLNGMAGTGKSTISRTVARSRSKQGDLGASFFFKRGEMDRGNLAKFVPTVARRLAWSTPAVALFIKGAVDADPVIVDRAVKEQFNKLVREPLSKATATPLSRPSVVIIVDALDECENDADIKLLVKLFSSLRFAGTLRVRVLITSRPELPVRLGFCSIIGTYRDLILHKVPQSAIEHDIAVFLRDEFTSIRNSFNEVAEEELKLPVHWPGESNLEKLTRAAVPLFIFAATLCRFVNDSCLGSPDELLQSVLHLTDNGHASKLDMTYSPVLKQQVVNRTGRERCDIIESFRLVVGTIITLASPLSMRALALLLDVHINKVTTRLRVLHSVLEVPESLDSPVRLLHLSFRDYLVDSENRETVEFWVDEKLTHRKLARHCLRVMRGALCENICGLSFPSGRRSAVGIWQLEERIPPELQYACTYWVHHQMKGDPESNDGDEVHDFLTTHFLHWLEVLSLLGRARECLDSLQSMAVWLIGRRDPSLSKFIADAIRFLQANFSVVTEAPLQIYSSALIFAPSKSIARKTFEDNIPKWITILPKVRENWDACLSTLEGHSSTVRIWNVEAGDCVRVLEGHSGEVNTVVFSHDSTKLASASSDKTVRIWNVETGDCVRVLEGYGELIGSMAFSHDSTKLALALEDKPTWLWYLKTGDYIEVLEDRSREVNTVVFSHDSTKLASASSDKTVRIWNVETGDCVQVLDSRSSEVHSVISSHDSTKTASVSHDRMIWIWNVEKGNCVQVLDSCSSDVSSVVFSHDSTKLAAATEYRMIRIWNAETGDCEQVLKGHSVWVWSVVFSHDSTKLASASGDKTVRIWNAETGDCVRVLEGHSGEVNTVVFSHDSTKLASASDDKTVRIWNAETVDCVQGLEGHSALIRSMAFSHDLTKLASASDDGTVRIWNVETGDCVQVLEGHYSRVNLVAFSHDSTKLASASDDQMIMVWSAETGKYMHDMVDHNSEVNLMVFSHDSTKLAAVRDNCLWIWNIETGRYKDALSLYTEGEVFLSFTPDGHGIVTDLGVYTLTGDLVSRAEPPMSLQPSDAPTLVSQDGNWVTTAGMDLLWLPPECRDGRVVVSGSTVAVGCRSGRVVFLGFSVGDIAKTAQL